jgi:hypothetical protein
MLVRCDFAARINATQGQLHAVRAHVNHVLALRGLVD